MTDDGRQMMAKAHIAFPETILVSDWLISKKSSPLKPLC
jgi:hypothetical protein